MNEKEKQLQSAIRTAFTGVCTATIATAITVTGAITSNSVAIIADMLATIFEFLAILLSWLTLRRICRHDAGTFNYGYGKLEGLASMAVAVMMFLSLGIVAFNAVRRFGQPQLIAGFGAWLMLMAHFIFGFINGSLFFRSFKLAGQQQSSLLSSQARLFATKTFANICMVAALSTGLLLKRYRWVPYIDPAVSILIAAGMFFGAYSIIRKNISDLLDKTLEEHFQILILRELSAFFEDYTAFHGLRSRKSGKNIYIEVFLEFDGSKPHAEVQRIMDRVKAALEAVIPDSDVTIASTTEPI